MTPSETNDQGFVAIALSPQVLPRAIKVGLIVGTILGAINHGDAILDGKFALTNLVQVVLTYLVPYGVSTFSAVQAIRQREAAN